MNDSAQIYFIIYFIGVIFCLIKLGHTSEFQKNNSNGVFFIFYFTMLLSWLGFISIVIDNWLNKHIK
jgi:hypothetical protein